MECRAGGNKAAAKPRAALLLQQILERKNAPGKEALNENCFGDRPVRRFKQRHHCDGAALCPGQLRRRGHEVVILAGGAPCEGKICAPVHRIPVFQKLIESQGMCFAKPDEEAYYTAFKDADIVHFYMPFRFCRRGRNWPARWAFPQ